MKAFVIKDKDACYFEEREMPQIKNPTDVIVKVKSAGICGSDLLIYEGKHALVTEARVPGHEFSGEVVEVGSAVKSLKPGDRVVNEPISYCGECYACRHGQPNVCSHLEVTGVTLDGGWQEYMCAPEKQWHKIPDWMTWKQAATVEPYTIAAQVCARAELQAGDTLLIHGCGPIGMTCLATAKAFGAKVIVSEVMPGRLEIAKKLGADRVVNSKEEDLETAVKEFTDGEGVNVIFDCAGVGFLMEKNIDMLSPAGRIVPVAMSNFKIDNAVWIMGKEIKIIGSRLQVGKFEPVIARFALYKDSVEEMITDVFPFEESDKAFEYADARHPETGKCVVLFD